MKRYNVRSLVTGDLMRVIGVQRCSGLLHVKVGGLFGGGTVLVSPDQVERA